jgi:hypothetical protein
MVSGAVLALLWWVAPTLGAVPIFGPNKEYRLTPNEGPYMLYVATFRGDPDNPDPNQRPQVMAHKLVYEIRSRCKVPAFVFSRSEQELQQEKQKLEQELQQRYGGNAPQNKTIRVHHEYAVLVGNYKDMDAARKALDGFKELEAKKKLPPLQGSTMAIADPRKPDAIHSGDVGSVKVKVDEVRLQNPLAHGFVVPNPLRPRQAPAPAAAQPKAFLSDLNQGEPYNLLKCQQPYTLVVKVFTPAVRTQSTRPSVFEANRPVLDANAGRELQAAAEQANQLAGVLRTKNLGYESFVWHTRNSSIVTVGSFKSPNDPELLKTQRLLAGMKIGSVELLPQPMPMEVPKQ